MEEEILKVKDSLQSSNLIAPYISKTTPAAQLVLNVPAVIKKFKPKFDPLKIGLLKYASVFIIAALQPGEIYVRFDDEDVPRYKQMQRELQKEFWSSTRRSASNCSSPIFLVSYNPRGI